MKVISPYISRAGFTLVELIVGMTIFAVGMTAILSLLDAAIKSSLTAKNEIIAANLLREQVELVKNIRNTNIRSFANWSAGITPGTYIIENDYTTSNTTYIAGLPSSGPVKMTASTILPSDTLKQKFLKSQLFLDSAGRFSHATSLTGTRLSSYITISPLLFTRPHGNPALRTIEPKSSDGKNQGYILDARVIIEGKEYREYDLKTLITDWQR